ncbi:MAG: diguanylate cyclase [Pseudomonadota bacterium]
MNLDVLLAIVLFIGAACYLLLGGRLIVSRREVGSVPVGLVFCLMGVWVLGGAVELLSTSFAVFSIGRSAHFVATALLPVIAFVCFRSYRGERTPALLVALLLIVPLTSIALAATNAYHEFMWFAPFSSPDGSYLTRPAEWGPWFLFAHAPYSYSLIAIAMFSLLMHSSAVAPAHRRGLFMLTAACLAPLAATLAYDVGLGPDTLSFVPLAVLAMLPVYAWLLIGERVIEFAPLAYETVFQTMQDPVVVVDEKQRIIGMNRGAERLLEVSERDALRSSLDAIMTDGATGVFDAIETGKPQKMITTTGRFMHIQVSSIETRGAAARGGQILMFRDVSDVEKAQLEVRNSEKLLRTLIDHSVNGIIRMRWVRNGDTGKRELRCIFANAAAGRFLDIDADRLNGRAGADIVRLASAGMDQVTAAAVLRRFHAAVELRESLDIDLQQQASGKERWLHLIAEPVGDDIAVTLVDVTDRKEREDQMASIAWFDPLTGVLNRRGFERDAAERLSASEDDASGALLFIDLNEFKHINDECGHEIGDQLLTIAAERLQQSLRTCDIIGRVGGDEFVALVPDVTAEVVDQLAGRLTEALEAPYRIADDTLRCAASIGLALYPDNANTLTGLLREADQAMYRAKARCRGVNGIKGADLLEKAV